MTSNTKMYLFGAGTSESFKWKLKDVMSSLSSNSLSLVLEGPNKEIKHLDFEGSFQGLWREISSSDISEGIVKYDKLCMEFGKARIRIVTLNKEQFSLNAEETYELLRGIARRLKL